MKLSDIIESVYKTKDDRFKETFSLDSMKNYLYKHLDFDQGNEHLINPLNRDKSVFYNRPRETLLTGEEKVNGRYLLLWEVGHDGTANIYSFDSSDELCDEIEETHDNNFISLTPILRGKAYIYTVDEYGVSFVIKQGKPKTV